MDPLCYSNIDLTTVVPKVNNMVVSTMIQRAGKVLRYGTVHPYINRKVGYYPVYSISLTTEVLCGSSCNIVVITYSQLGLDSIMLHVPGILTKMCIYPV